MILLHDLYLLYPGLVQHIFRNLHVPWLQQANEIDDVYNFGMRPAVCRILRMGFVTGKTKQQQYCNEFPEKKVD